MKGSAFLATDAFGRPGPGRSPGRSLPSFCRHRKKGPAGEAVEEMSHKITEKGTGRNETQNRKPPRSRNGLRPVLKERNRRRERLLGAPAAGYRPVSFRPPWLSLRENRQKEITSPAFPKTILFPGGGLLKAVLVSRQSLSFYALVRLRGSRVGYDGGGTPLSLPAGSDQGLRGPGPAARKPGRAGRGCAPQRGLTTDC